MRRRLQARTRRSVPVILSVVAGTRGPPPGSGFPRSKINVRRVGAINRRRPMPGRLGVPKKLGIQHGAIKLGPHSRDATKRGLPPLGRTNR